MTTTGATASDGATPPAPPPAARARAAAQQQLHPPSQEHPYPWPRHPRDRPASAAGGVPPTRSVHPHARQSWWSPRRRQQKQKGKQRVSGWPPATRAGGGTPPPPPAYPTAMGGRRQAAAGPLGSVATTTTPPPPCPPLRQPAVAAWLPGAVTLLPSTAAPRPPPLGWPARAQRTSLQPQLDLPQGHAVAPSFMVGEEGGGKRGA